MADRALTVENETDVELGFVLCRKMVDDTLHLHIVDPEETDEVHGEPVRSFDAPGMRTILEGAVNEGEI